MIFSLFEEYEEATSPWFYIEIILYTEDNKYRLEMPFIACCRDVDYCNDLIAQLHTQLRETFLFERRFEEIPRSYVPEKTEQIKTIYRGYKKLELNVMHQLMRNYRFDKDSQCFEEKVENYNIEGDPFILYVKRPKDLTFNILRDLKCYIDINRLGHRKYKHP